MPTQVASAGLAVVRVAEGGVVEVLIGHLGGPFWTKKTDGAWSFPKGVVEVGEAPMEAAFREFGEETGLRLGDGSPSVVDLGTVATSAKVIHLFVVRAEPDLALFAPGHFELEWPPRSGRRQTFPEIDQVRWAALDDARPLLSAGQRPFLDRIVSLKLG